MMRNEYFDTHDPISVLGFFKTFKITCDSNKVHEGTAMWTLPNFLKKLVGYTFTSRIRAPSHSNRTVDKKLTSYLAVVNHLLETYATEDIIAEA